MNTETIHPESVLGQGRAKWGELEAARNAAAGLVERRRAALAEAEGALAGVAIDTDKVAEVARLISRVSALTHLCGVAKVERERLIGVTEQVGAKVSALELRVRRAQGEIAGLEDENRVYPYTPAQRRGRLALERFKLGVLIGDPKELEQLRKEVETHDPHERGAVWGNLDLNPPYIPLGRVERELRSLGT